MNPEEFVLSALKDNSIMWDEKTLKKVAFSLIDMPNPDGLIKKVTTRGAYDCIKLFAIFNFLVIDSMERDTGESISQIKYCAQKLRQSDRTVNSLVNLKMDEVDRRIQRMLQISRSLADTQNADEMIRAINRKKASLTFIHFRLIIPFMFCF
ncbi:hypothetical protein [Candidatus Villigracilis affinis]|uniref:hypothetical protein n=1 Tax=Candidatus Villigracilis affinis TaxID=3140682 RepID=UPI002A1F61AF|nr:hypothetical protein [Anaerolineales bacterium]